MMHILQFLWCSKANKRWGAPFLICWQGYRGRITPSHFVSWCFLLYFYQSVEILVRLISTNNYKWFGFCFYDFWQIRLQLLFVILFYSYYFKKNNYCCTNECEHTHCLVNCNNWTVNLIIASPLSAPRQFHGDSRIQIRFVSNCTFRVGDDD